MKNWMVIGVLSLVFWGACKKQAPNPECVEPEAPWERFVGTYKVYDTTGIYLYDCIIFHYKYRSRYGADTVDYLGIQNFADSFNLPIQFSQYENPNVLGVGIHDSIPDNRGKHWFVATEVEDLGTPYLENTLVNDTIVFYFEMTNIKYYIYEAQPFFRCAGCKHVAVKQG